MKRTMKMNPNKIYNSKLKKVEFQLGNGTTNSEQLNKVGKQLFKDKYLGTFASDQIPKFTKSGQMAIVNLDNHTQQGSHWIGLYYQDPYLGVYDSFGRDTAKIIPTIYNPKIYKIVDSEYDPEQSVQEDNCGQRSLSWLYTADKLGLKKALEI